MRERRKYWLPALFPLTSLFSKLGDMWSTIEQPMKFDSVCSKLSLVVKCRTHNLETWAGASLETRDFFMGVSLDNTLQTPGLVVVQPRVLIISRKNAFENIVGNEKMLVTRIFSLAVFRENLRHWFSLGIVCVVVVQKL